MTATNQARKLLEAASPDILRRLQKASEQPCEFHELSNDCGERAALRLAAKAPATLTVAITLAEYARLAAVGADCIEEHCNRLEDERTGYTSIRRFRETLATLRHEAKRQRTDAGKALAEMEKLFPETQRPANGGEEEG